MNSKVVPLTDLGKRLPEAGRIRTGIEVPPPRRMKAIDTFRFTSPSPDQVELLAMKYGGKAGAWSPSTGRDEFEVVTESAEIEVVIFATSLGDTPLYELWSAAGLLRRCDGVTLMVPTTTPDGVIQQEAPCICNRKGAMECKVITRLSVFLPDLPFTGVWRLDTHSWHASKEMPAMVDVVMGMQNAGYARAKLAIEKRTDKKDGKTRHFNVVAIRTAGTFNELAEGMARVASMGSSFIPLELEPGDTDDDVVDAELVDEPSAEERQLLSDALLLASKLQLSTDDIAGFTFVVTDGAESNVRHLGPAALRRIVVVLERVHKGELVYRGLKCLRATVSKAGE